jgi:hypothetical protein
VIKDIDEFNSLTAQGAVGVSFGIVYDDKLIFSKFYGTRDKKNPSS